MNKLHRKLHADRARMVRIIAKHIDQPPKEFAIWYNQEALSLKTAANNVLNMRDSKLQSLFYVLKPELIKDQTAAHQANVFTVKFPIWVFAKERDCSKDVYDKHYCNYTTFVNRYN